MSALRPTIKRLVSSRCDRELTQARVGIMLHFDGSSSDSGAVEWFSDPACNVSYNRLYLDNGDVVQITPNMNHRAWHAGVCRKTATVRDANSAFYGLAAATNEKVPVTDAQFNAIVDDCVALMQQHGWTAADVDTRIVGHDEWAVYKKGHPKAGKLGRKMDPTGLHKKAPILSTQKVRDAVRKRLT